MQDNNNHSHSHLSNTFCKKSGLTHISISMMLKGTLTHEEEGMSE